MIEIELPDGSKMSVESGISGLDVAGKISEGLAKNALAVSFNGKLQDVYTPLTTSGTLSIITSKNKEALEILRHTASHIMAQAVQSLYPRAQVTIGRWWTTAFITILTIWISNWTIWLQLKRKWPILWRRIIRCGAK